MRVESAAQRAAAFTIRQTKVGKRLRVFGFRRILPWESSPPCILHHVSFKPLYTGGGRPALGGGRPVYPSVYENQEWRLVAES